MLARYGVMTELDSGALARYAVIWCRWVDAEDAVKRVGPTVTTVAGNLIQNPHLSLAEAVEKVGGEFDRGIDWRRR